MLLLLSLALADDNETPVALEDLPAEVRAAVEARFPGATLIEAELDGKLYDVDVKTAEGELWEAEVTAKGKIKDVEREDDDEDESEDDDDEKDDD